MADEPNVNEETVSEQEQVSQESQDSTPTLTKELEDMISQKIDSVITEVTGAAKREIQSVKDKSKAEVENAIRRANLSESALAQMKGEMENLDPEVRNVLEVAGLKAENAAYKQRDAEHERIQQLYAYGQKQKDEISAYLKELGVDENDPRLDMGRDAKDLNEGWRRLTTSAHKIVMEDNQKAFDKKFEDMEKRLRGDLGIDEQDTSTSTVNTIDGIPTDMARFKVWLRSIAGTDKYAELKPKIDKMLDEGKIK